MRNSAMRLLTAGALVLSMVIPATALAAQGDCGQPVSSGDKPTARDCLFDLRAAVGIDSRWVLVYSR
jgi:hypothetical protein